MEKEKLTPDCALELLDYENKPVIAMTLIYILRGDEVLLLERAGDREMVPDKILGLGGKVEPGENVMDSAVREVWEEAGIRVEGLELRGVWMWLSDKNRISQGLIFVGRVPEGTEFETDGREGNLMWVKESEVLELPGLADHQIVFLPTVLEGKDFYASMVVYNDGEQVRYADNKEYLEGRRK